MELELIPRPPDDQADAVSAALERAQVDLDPRDDVYASAWRAAGLREGVGREPGDGPGLGPQPSLL